MSLLQVLPVAARLAPLAERLTDRLAQGLSFANLLNEHPESAATPEVSSESQAEFEISQLSPRQDRHLAEFGQRELEDFAFELEQRLASEGIDSSLEFELKLDASGTPVVAGNHPQRAEIEKILSSSAKLEKQFQQVASIFSSYQRLRSGDVNNGDFVLAFSGGAEPEVQFA